MKTTSKETAAVAIRRGLEINDLTRISYAPGNGTLYEILVAPYHGAWMLFCLVNFGTCVKLVGLPGEEGYLEEKLRVCAGDAKALYELLVAVRG